MLLGEQRWREDLSFAKAVNEGASHTSPRQHPVCSSNKAQRSSESTRPPDPHPAALHSRNLPRQGRAFGVPAGPCVDVKVERAQG